MWQYTSMSRTCVVIVVRVISGSVVAWQGTYRVVIRVIWDIGKYASERGLAGLSV